ncbi:GH23688 [Drosophila grimshawi]|uniref:GH23688 n=1 Tax=Drosophila grimshawi TaxID=7222 RepID=B4K2K2_DROGR|nr:GH23688 [Drosophila grimshawi]
MADEKKSDTTDNKDRQSTEERPENAATSYGLEDHEATAMDPRVNELRMARSQHGRRLSKTSKTSKSLTASPSTITHHPANPELGSPNAATNYGLEGYKVTKADPRIINMQTPKRSPPTTQQPPQPPQLEEPQNLVVFKPKLFTTTTSSKLFTTITSSKRFTTTTNTTATTTTATANSCKTPTSSVETVNCAYC